MSAARTLTLMAAGLLLPGLGLALAQGIERLTLPESSAEQPPAIRCHVVVDRESISVDGAQMLRLETQSEDDGRSVLSVPPDELRGQLITRLYDRLLERAEQEKSRAASYGTLEVLTQRDLGFKGELLLSVDVDTPFAVVREVLYSAGQAQFGTFLFMTHNPWEDAQRVVTSTLPALGPSRPDDPDERPPLNLSIVVTAEGLTILGADAVLEPAGTPRGEGPTVPCDGACAGVDDYDWAELNRLLGLVKDEYPDDLQVIVVPESQVSFEVLVRALDTARWAPHLPQDAELGTWQRWKRARRELFPSSILAGGAE